MTHLKRLIDLAVSVIALAILSPLMLAIVICLRLTGEGEIFYRQPRIGRGGTEFSILKFATMLKDSPMMLGGDITTASDSRVLPVGRFLRSTKLNELPQLLNIVKGDMSLIGPRPLTKKVAAMFPDSYWKSVRHLAPGLSGVGSIIFRDEEVLLSGAPSREQVYLEAIVPYKIALEEWYAARQSTWLDLRLIFVTIAVVAIPSIDANHLLPDLPPVTGALDELRRHAKSQQFVRR